MSGRACGVYDWMDEQTCCEVRVLSDDEVW